MGIRRLEPLLSSSINRYIFTPTGGSGGGGGGGGTPGGHRLKSPTELAVVQIAGGAILTWSKSPSATIYTIYRGPAPGRESPTPIATLGNVRTYTDLGLSVGTTYFYYVTADNTHAVASFPSNEVHVTLTSAALNSLDFSQIGNSMYVPMLYWGM